MSDVKMRSQAKKVSEPLFYSKFTHFVRGICSNNGFEIVNNFTNNITLSIATFSFMSSDKT